jgi:hypothetical protein
MFQLDPVPIHARERGKPRAARPKSRVQVGRIRWGALVRPITRDGFQAIVATAPEPQAVADQPAEGEEEYVEPF